MPSPETLQAPRRETRGWRTRTLLGLGGLSMLVAACSSPTPPPGEQSGPPTSITTTQKPEFKQLGPPDNQQDLESVAARHAIAAREEAQARIDQGQPISLAVLNNSCIAWYLDPTEDAVVENPAMYTTGDGTPEKTSYYMVAPAINIPGGSQELFNGPYTYENDQTQPPQKFSSSPTIVYSQSNYDYKVHNNLTVQFSQSDSGAYPTGWLDDGHGNRFSVTRFVPADKINEAFPGVCIFSETPPSYDPNPTAPATTETTMTI